MKNSDELFLGLNPLDPADGLSDADNDGLNFSFEFSLGTNHLLADTDGDGVSDSLEVLIYATNPLSPLSKPTLNQVTSSTPLDPNTSQTTSPTTAASSTTPPAPSLSNGEFEAPELTNWTSTKLITDYQGGKFDWSAGNISSWSAYVGSSIEVWKAGGTFVELDGSIGNYGIKQGIANPAAGGYILTWQQSGRNNVKTKNDAYRVRVYHMNGNAEVVIAQTSVISGISKLTWTPNALAFQITPAQIAAAAANNSPIYVAYIPGDNDTFGTLIDKVVLSPVEFNADNEDDGDIDIEDDQVEDTRRLIVPLKLNKADGDCARKIKLAISPPAGATIKIKKTGSGKVSIKRFGSEAVLMGQDATESQELNTLLISGNTMLDLFGYKNGEVNLSLELKLSNQLTVLDSIALRVCNADVIFRAGDAKLAEIIDSTFTHGGVDTGDDRIYDTAEAGISTGTGQTEAAFYASATPGYRKRTIFKLDNYMAGRIIEKLHDNLRSGRFENPTAPVKWNLFTTSNNYSTSNCVEWIHHQWRKAVGDVYGGLTKPEQLHRFSEAYYTGEATVKNLLDGTLVKTAVSGPVGYAEAYVLGLIGGVNIHLDDGKAAWDNKFEGEFYYYYPGYYDVPLSNVPWWVPLTVDLHSEGRLITVTAKSYYQSPYFKEVTF